MASYRSWLHLHLEVRETKKQGKGVFAKKPVRKGERLAILGGDIMLIDEIDNLPQELQDYPMQIEERFVLGARTPTPEPEDTDFFNHSCNPNAGFKGQIFLVALRDIRKDEEITFDYAMILSPSVGSDIKGDMDCNCGTKKCRKKITDDDWKIPALRNRYHGYFSQYLQERIDSGE